ncbi:hypothetical protein [Roseovarius indicus]|uniref:Uncharacterized protein n=1 Tax=Roseovarius indicus TaxID=540747 RepID=A0A0T5PF85_9RHOB|nr:hypothetical protein [Roseovarius indicus]KRS19745.1 hypothetical protein XM52_02635 [Roseovarius indicus]QEW28900.1 hypothetical protein RIdsm_04741 [Roseovarius indicus]SFD82875.1 hypothetical protein SAMN04488031_102761 [Roseovarius indicus]
MTNERASANSPAMSRRTILTALPVSGAALALPASGTACSPDPVASLYREWLDTRKEWRELAELPGNGDFDDPRSIAAQAREFRIEKQMLALRPTSLEGIAGLAALAWAYVDPGFIDADELAEHAQSGDCRTIVAIWKACTGLEGYPIT